ncbi:amidase [Candidatus Nanopelagicales bacterium]|nr:amidase [Candidatus Nanopelagicales bacterium]
MKFTEYQAMDATALAQALASGDLTATDVLETAQRRLQRVDPLINAVILDLYQSGRQQIAAGLPDGPFQGVPFLVKDMDGTLAGTPAAAGSRSLQDYVYDHDSELFGRFRKSGVVFLGKTNCPEFGIMAITEPELHGPSRNPWDLNHTPGGSSGGSAAAVAAGVVPVAHAGDGGGSIRIPAAMCGLFGFKPSRGRQPLGPDISEAWNGQVVPHVVSRSVRDSAGFLSATRGKDIGAPYDEPGGDHAFLAALERSPGTLRVGFSTQAMLGSQMDPDCVAAVQDAAALMTELGHEVSEVDLPVNAEEMAMAYLTVVAAGVAASVALTENLTGQAPRPELFERPTWFLKQVGEVLSAKDLELAKFAVGTMSRNVAHTFENLDIHISATTAFPPAQIGELGLGRLEKVSLSALRRISAVAGPTTDPIYRQALRQLSAESLARTPNTQVYNMTGQPAMSVPLSMNKAGLPIGVQFAAGFGAESLLFSVANQLEEARPWFDRVPQL